MVTLEQHRVGLWEFTYTQIFFIKYTAYLGEICNSLKKLTNCVAVAKKDLKN